MVVYVLVALAALAILIGGYRVLGGAAVRVVDPASLLRDARETAVQIAAELSDAVTAGADARGAGGRLAEAARSARRRTDGCAQQLERLDPAAFDDTALVEAYAFTVAAVEDLGWAARICAAPGYASNPGLQRAADGLRGSADRLLDDARGALSSAPT
jgi:hypothetical protein